MTPTRRLRVVRAAVTAPGRTTPRMGRSYRRRKSPRATAVDVLQATTIALTSRAASSSRASIENARTSSSGRGGRSEEHTSELQSHHELVCRLLLEKKKKLLETE